MPRCVTYAIGLCTLLLGSVISLKIPGNPYLNFAFLCESNDYVVDGMTLKDLCDQVLFLSVIPRADAALSDLPSNLIGQLYFFDDSTVCDDPSITDLTPYAATNKIYEVSVNDTEMYYSRGRPMAKTRHDTDVGDITVTVTDPACHHTCLVAGVDIGTGTYYRLGQRNFVTDCNNARNSFDAVLLVTGVQDINKQLHIEPTRQLDGTYTVPLTNIITSVSVMSNKSIHTAHTALPNTVMMWLRRMDDDYTMTGVMQESCPDSTLPHMLPHDEHVGHFSLTTLEAGVVQTRTSFSDFTISFLDEETCPLCGHVRLYVMFDPFHVHHDGEKDYCNNLAVINLNINCDTFYNNSDEHEARSVAYYNPWDQNMMTKWCSAARGHRFYFGKPRDMGDGLGLALVPVPVHLMAPREARLFLSANAKLKVLSRMLEENGQCSLADSGDADFIRPFKADPSTPSNPFPGTIRDMADNYESMKHSTPPLLNGSLPESDKIMGCILSAYHRDYEYSLHESDYAWVYEGCAELIRLIEAGTCPTHEFMASADPIPLFTYLLGSSPNHTAMASHHCNRSQDNIPQSDVGTGVCGTRLILNMTESDPDFQLRFLRGLREIIEQDYYDYFMGYRDYAHDTQNIHEDWPHFDTMTQHYYDTYRWFTHGWIYVEDLKYVAFCARPHLFSSPPFAPLYYTVNDGKLKMGLQDPHNYGNTCWRTQARLTCASCHNDAYHDIMYRIEETVHKDY